MVGQDQQALALQALGAALIEAAGLLADGEDEVIVVHYDAPLPGDYGAFADEPPAAYAWAWRVATPRDGEPHLRLTLGAADASGAAPAAQLALPFGLALLRFGLSDALHWQAAADGLVWRFSRHAGQPHD